jgi:hypothetical protein
VIRRPLFLLFSLLLCLGGVGFLAYRPATVTGVDANQLASSLKDAAGGAHARCEHVHGSTWRCAARDDGSGAVAPYRVETHSFGCWKGQITGPGSPRLPRRPSGCISIFDFL